MTAPVSGADLLARIRPQLAEDSTVICLRPDLLETWRDAEEKLQELVADQMKDQGTRLAEKPEKAASQRELAEQVKDLEQQILDSSAEFRFRALPKDEWRALLDDHPPRKGNEVDLAVGFNRDAVLDAAVRLCLIDPEFDDASWREFVRTVNAGEWEELRTTVNRVNRGVVEPPKSALASAILLRQGAASRPQPGSEPAPADSTAGSPERSTSTTQRMA